MGEASILTLLRERAGLQGDETAATFVDYENNWDGSTENLTYSELYRRACNVARELDRRGSPGDRALILAPQGLDYIVAFFGALQAGLIAVPLAVPLGGVSDERVSSVLQDAAPTVVLTTSAVAGAVTDFVRSQTGVPEPAIIQVDSLPLDAPAASGIQGESGTDTAYLQYTSGSTRNPAGVMMSHRNLLANYEQLMSGYFAEFGNVIPEGSAIVSWLPFYHDMGLYLGVCGPVLAGVPAVLMSPVAFLQRPARWMQMLATNGRTYTAAPNFAFELAVRKTSDDDMAGLDLSEVLAIITGSERVHPATLERFTQRFARQNLSPKVIRPSYGMAEATVYIATRRSGEPPAIVRFESEPLTAGTARRCQNGAGTPLVSYGVPVSPMVRIVDSETDTECPDGTVGEICVHGDNVASGYWHRPQETRSTFGAKIAAPSEGTPEGPWLRTGDSGFIFDDELFIIGRIKDLLIVYGRNHSPDDIEATVQEISRSRCVAIAVPDGHTEKLVVIMEVKQRAATSETPEDPLSTVKREVASAIFNAHSLGVADLVLVPPGSIPITTSGKVRRAVCVDQYRQGEFARLDA
ncbi:AMP-binding protein [Mycolicibacterium sp. 050232]|uniref:AMP-binding protein n=1 Tax=Mycolicibacterium sp. 050232 TaxID=3113982 RepID=UPI002E2AA765|nr:AMP-binding protein [Mycolicibacterium sp. 050232]MED5814931.1 AMP-binding protein [Mycolicibacterium sp. 050232]